MTSQLISFRLSETEIEALKAFQQNGESVNLIAQKIVREALGLPAEDKAADRPGLEQLIESIVSTKLADIEDRMEKLKA